MADPVRVQREESFQTSGPPAVLTVGYVHPDDLARAIREGVDARLRAVVEEVHRLQDHHKLDRLHGGHLLIALKRVSKWGEQPDPTTTRENYAFQSAPGHGATSAASPSTNSEPAQERAACYCHWCIREHAIKGPGGLPLSATQMIVCPTCGNKRCPHASDHRLACTGSNEPGQPGSVYTAKPAQERARAIAIEYMACTCFAPHASPDGRGPLKDGSHYADCPAKDACDAITDIAAAIRAAVAAETGRCAAIASATAAGKSLGDAETWAALEIARAIREAPPPQETQT